MNVFEGMHYFYLTLRFFDEKFKELSCSFSSLLLNTEYANEKNKGNKKPVFFACIILYLTACLLNLFVCTQKKSDGQESAE